MVFKRKSETNYRNIHSAHTHDMNLFDLIESFLCARMAYINFALNAFVDSKCGQNMWLLMRQKPNVYQRKWFALEPVPLQIPAFNFIIIFIIIARQFAFDLHSPV